MSSENRVALIIGMDVYDSTELEPLSHCKKNAEGLYRLLLNLDYTIFRDSPIIGSKLDKEYGWVNVREYIADFFDVVKSSSTLLFYFSGYGIQGHDDAYLGTPEVDPDYPFKKGFAVSDLAKLVNSSRAEQTVCIIDACSSGAAKRNSLVTSKYDEDKITGFADGISRRISPTGRRYMLVSTQPYESSFNGTSETYSVFTKYLIEGFKGVEPAVDEKGKILSHTGSVDETGNVTVESLHSYIYYKLADVTPFPPKFKAEGVTGTAILASYPALLKKDKEITGENLFKLLQEGRIKEFNDSLEGDPEIVLNFPGANLERANLEEVNLAAANLVGVTLEEANLTGATLEEANLTGANLRYASLRGANCRKANLMGADLTGAKIVGADLTRANIVGANLEAANLRSANLRSTNLRGANLEVADLFGANLKEANLTGANLFGANLKGANLAGSDLSLGNLQKSDLTAANLFGANLTGANLTGARLDKTNLRETVGASFTEDPHKQL